MAGWQVSGVHVGDWGGRFFLLTACMTPFGARSTHCNPIQLQPAPLSFQPPAGGLPDSGPTCALCIAALSRMLRRWSGCQVSVAHAGAIVAAAVDALDASHGAALRAACLQPAAALVRDLSARVPTVAGGSGISDASSSCIVAARAWLAVDGDESTPKPGDATLLVGEVFDLAAAAKKHVLLLPLRPQEPAAAAADMPPARRLHGRDTINRAEAAMMEHWFGAQSSADSSEAGAAPAAPKQSGSPPPPPPPADDAGAAMAHALAAGAPVYPSAIAAGVCVLGASELLGSAVGAVGLSPGAEYAAALLPAGRCVVVWRLATGWGHKLAHLGRPGPAAQLPYCYLPLGEAGPAASASAAGAPAPGFDLSWALRWMGEDGLELLQHGQACAAWEVWQHSG